MATPKSIMYKGQKYVLAAGKITEKSLFYLAQKVISSMGADVRTEDSSGKPFPGLKLTVLNSQPHHKQQFMRELAALEAAIKKAGAKFKRTVSSSEVVYMVKP